MLSPTIPIIGLSHLIFLSTEADIPKKKKDSRDNNVIEEFWKSFYVKLNTIKKSVSSSSNIGLYQNSVFNLLKKEKGDSDKDLESLQIEIENLSV